MSDPSSPETPSAAVPLSETWPPLGQADAAVREAAAHLVRTVAAAATRPPLGEPAFQATLERYADQRGQPLALPLLSGGVGQGAAITLADGRRIIDMVSGIGPCAFGHADADLIETAAIAAAADVAFQGHVLPGPEYARLLDRLLQMAGPRFAHAWLALSGSMANENALKLIFQRRAPADQIIAFEGAFHGRTLGMSEMTDRPEYRDGLPLRGFVHRVPFYDPLDPGSAEKSLAALNAILARSPERVAAFCFELVQGEGGFNTAPRAFFETLMTRCREASVSVWVDEIQTFARTGELFAFQTLGLDAFVDVVTAGKILQGSAVLFARDHRPRPGLVGGTWAGSAVGMAVGYRILERLAQQHYLGPEGQVARLAGRIDEAFAALRERTRKTLPGAIGARSGLGLMQAFVPFEGEPETVKRIIELSLEEGVLFQPAGRRPMKIRLLPPLNLTQTELDAAFSALERALFRFAAERRSEPGS